MHIYCRILQAILETRTNIQLESLELELVDKISDDELLFQNTISAFVASFQGLKAFHLRTDLLHRPSDIWAAIKRHRVTLKQLVWHDRRDPRTQEPRCYMKECSLYDMFNDDSQYPGQFPLLESVGLGTNCHLKVSVSVSEGSSHKH